jgi:hypothetical protein
MSVAKDTTTVRVSQRTHGQLRELARHEQRSVQDIVARLVAAEARRQVIAAHGRAMAAIDADPVLRARYEAERQAWEDAALADAAGGLPGRDGTSGSS